jgi:hypothetical protein
MRKGYITLLFFVYILSFIIVINFKTPLIGEDFALSIPYSHKNENLYEKVSLISNKIVVQSTNWNARLGEQLAIIFLAFNKSFFRILNIIVTFIFFYLILTYAKGDFPSINPTFFFLITLQISIFLLIPKVGDILFWITVASNYLWGVSILILFLLPYRLWYSGKDMFENASIMLRFLFIPLTVLAGMTNENTVIAVILMIIAGFIFAKKGFFKTMPTPRWYWQNMAFLLVGYGYLILSPSTKRRRGYYLELFGTQNEGIIDYLSKSINVLQHYIVSSKNLIILIVIFTLLFLILTKWYGWNLSKKSKDNLVVSLILTFCSFVSVAVLIAAPYLESRSLLFNWFFLFVFFTIIIIELYSQKRILILLTIPLLIIGFAQTPIIFNCSSRLYEEAATRHNEILTQINSGSRHIKVHRFNTYCPRVFSSREGWLIETGHDEVYYGVEDIKIMSP